MKIFDKNIFYNNFEWRSSKKLSKNDHKLLSAVISDGKDLLFWGRMDFPVLEEPFPFGRHKI